VIVMKKRMKKLQLSRETLRALTDVQAAGALAADQQEIGKALSIPRCTYVVSDCKYCTTPIDGCPDPTVA
jgi:hypothetical protein